MRRHRLTWDNKTAARAPSGLYGYTKKVQADCETCVRKLDRHATSLVRSAYSKDERIVAFLQTHSKRAKSSSARVLLAALKASAPKIAGKGGKVAASKTYGLYGFPSNTVKLGLAMCSQLREQAGLLTASLHARRVAKHARITSFLKDHSKKARCYSARMLLAGYPDADAKYASAVPGKKASDLTAASEDLDDVLRAMHWNRGMKWRYTPQPEDAAGGPTDSSVLASWLNWGGGAVASSLRALYNKGLVGAVPGGRGRNRWYLTPAGLSAAERLPPKVASDHMVTAGVDSWLAWDMDEMDEDFSHYG
jgi:hypothetical protein